MGQPVVATCSNLDMTDPGLDMSVMGEVSHLKSKT
jgi:hypothetical protein